MVRAASRASEDCDFENADALNYVRQVFGLSHYQLSPPVDACLARAYDICLTFRSDDGL